MKPKPVEIVDEVPKKKKVTFENDSESERESEPEPEPEESLENDSKRAITYEMKKNKGLTPHRKKEQRNPRVKHRNKFRKAKIRRKGAVREVRKELSRYGGEMSGIKSSVTKSIKIKWNAEKIAVYFYICYVTISTEPYRFVYNKYVGGCWNLVLIYRALYPEVFFLLWEINYICIRWLCVKRPVRKDNRKYLTFLLLAKW